MKIVAIAIIIIYAVALLFIFSYSIVQLNLVFLYLRKKIREKRKPKSIAADITEFPLVTIQLPIYNELYVAERLLDAVSQIDYPKDKLEIQVLDDSDDETVETIRKKTDELSAAGLNIVHVRRDSRVGYKAGALAYGLEIAKGDFIAIFDSDFLPEKYFLKKTIPQFADSRVGAVQTRWTHLNKDYSMLTRLQAFGLDAHFSIEQTGRNTGGHFINFNGTAGIWRKRCITDAGGWQSDTLTEDLDLSYRAQLKKWKFVYMEDVNSPAELPVTMSALKNQQFRWNKGAAECAKKNLISVLVQKDLKFGTKIHAIFHLMNSSVFIAIMITALLSIPMLLVKNEFEQFEVIFYYASFFLLSFLVLSVFYYTALAQHDKSFPKNFYHFLQKFPLFLSISMGLALHNAVAVLEGYAGKKSSFIRTPKFNLKAGGETWKSNKYLQNSINAMTIVEGILAIYFAWGMYLAFRVDDFGLFPFHLLLAFGFGFVCFYSVVHSGPSAGKGKKIEFPAEAQAG
ncbi:MAG: glycosyltransferase family 2 protein [Chitinophagales bacterium]|nr:glycosyltransferase family 2 protein [Chitinophagales bacterium]